MATLHMDIENMEQLLSAFVICQEKIEKSLLELDKKVNDVAGQYWIGNSASDFLHSYENLKKEFIEDLQSAENLRRILEMEMTEWQQMSARMR